MVTNNDNNNNNNNDNNDGNIKSIAITMVITDLDNDNLSTNNNSNGNTNDDDKWVIIVTIKTVPTLFWFKDYHQFSIIIPPNKIRKSQTPNTKITSTRHIF